ncbi:MULTISPECIES: ATP-dependent DNA helicase [unclassified Mesobacillus]|uniref:ATP-dependent DNA helicase n=1 Tax=unclassified Mesobacillus TaxID=2675270 RepID=UPI00203BD265|nr:MULTISPECIES: ATP-dependent DNA helicase [unclassified Mesobacillus]MCM3121850.1 ATP-dependent DNA helicase [Mesobacillus sp. MER 33]MCM3231814.1 ATP-dependent DNA helicase [Mesobacillus sp. MER 48]
MEHVIKIPVRMLAEYVFKTGSIESGFKTASSFSEGSRIHREVQNTYQEMDQSEVFLKTEIEFDNLLFIIEGRCDGLLFSGEKTTIDEIKSTSLPLESIEENSNPAHWAQAECYGYMFLKEHQNEEIDIQLTYVHKTSGDKKFFKRSFTKEELENSVKGMVADFAPYARLQAEHGLKRDQSIKKLKFPFPRYRHGQRQLAGAVYKTIEEGRTLFANAPTGIGKTISTVFPSVKAIGEEQIKKLFYLTAKTTTRQTAEEAFSLMIKKGLEIRTVTITAKDKVCFTGEGKCSKEHCEFADGYYDRINGAVLDILRNEAILDRCCIEKYAKKHRVCPFEFSLDLAYAADAVICDYNYIFDPKVSLKRLFDEQKKKTVLLVDEAHNLVDRGRDMFSAALEKSPFLQLKREFKEKNHSLGHISKRLNDYFIQLRKQAGFSKTIECVEPLEELNQLIAEFMEHAEKELLRGSAGESDLLLETFFVAQNWQRISSLYDERFIVYALIEKNDVRIKQFCLDPSHLIKQAGKSFKSRIFFSATLNPMGYYRDMLGGDSEDYVSLIPSPFSSEQTDVKIQSLSTRYKDRTRSIKPIVKTMSDLVHNYPGNYLFFFPSYQYLNMVLEEWSISNEDICTIVQGTGMNEEERAAFLESFTADNQGSLVGFAVLGGVFSEGIDLKGDRLNGVVVVGVGLPQIGFERDLISKHFAAIGKNGYDYAYVFPGMNKVLQAGGRLIRSEDDTGRIVLIDDRYLHNKYQALLPDAWKKFTLLY